MLLDRRADNLFFKIANICVTWTDLVTLVTLVTLLDISDDTDESTLLRFRPTCDLNHYEQL